MKKRTAAVVVLSFVAGFLVHAFFFPYLFVDGDTKQAKEEIKRVQKQFENVVKEDDFITYVEYKNNAFTPSSVTIKKANYIAITNVDPKNQMWLQSDNPLLETKRGYALSERVEYPLNEPGTYKVKEIIGNKAELTVKVLP